MPERTAFERNGVEACLTQQRRRSLRPTAALRAARDDGRAPGDLVEPRGELFAGDVTYVGHVPLGDLLRTADVDDHGAGKVLARHRVAWTVGARSIARARSKPPHTAAGNTRTGVDPVTSETTAGPGQWPTRPRPTPKRAAPPTRRSMRSVPTSIVSPSPRSPGQGLGTIRREPTGSHGRHALEPAAARRAPRQRRTSRRPHSLIRPPRD